MGATEIVASHDDTTFQAYRLLILSELQRLSRGQDANNDAVNKLAREFTTALGEVKSEITSLKVKSTIWGSVGSAVTMAVTVGIYAIASLLK